jgi:peptide deformylase
MIRPILTYGAAILRQRTRPVTEFTGALQVLIDDLVETMYVAPGLGLSANQVGSPQRLFVANPSEHRDPKSLLVVLNPEIVESGGEQTSEEGCLSIPEFREDVCRASRVVLTGLDRAGQAIEIEATDLFARILQHETDHLNGLLFVDRLSPAKKDIVLRKLKKTFLDGKA